MKPLTPISSLLAALPSGGDSPAPQRMQQQLLTFWREHMGATGVHSWPLLFASGRLVVFAESAAWGNEIRHQSPSLIQTLAEHDIVITTIHVKTRPVSFVDERKPEPPPKLSRQSAAQIEQLAGNVEHSGLKRSLHRLAKRVNKG